jgi:hypothetical protein
MYSTPVPFHSPVLVVLMSLDFHCTLAISGSFVDFCLAQDTSPAVLSHVSKAYSQINQRLSGTDAVSDQAIVSVIGLALFERIHHQNHRVRVHFDGLKEMVALRGGLPKLGCNPGLLHKLCRYDTESLHTSHMMLTTMAKT